MKYSSDPYLSPAEEVSQKLLRAAAINPKAALNRAKLDEADADEEEMAIRANLTNLELDVAQWQQDFEATYADLRNLIEALPELTKRVAILHERTRQIVLIRDAIRIVREGGEQLKGAAWRHELNRQWDAVGGRRPGLMPLYPSTGRPVHTWRALINFVTGRKVRTYGSEMANDMALEKRVL